MINMSVLIFNTEELVRTLRRGVSISPVRKKLNGLVPRAVAQKADEVRMAANSCTLVYHAFNIKEVLIAG